MNEKRTRVLIVDDEPAHALAIRRALEHARPAFEVQVAGTLREFDEVVHDAPPDLALVDLNLPDGRAVEILTSPPEAGDFPVLIMTSYGSEASAVEAMKAGALDYVVKSPAAFLSMPQSIAGALREWRLLKQRQQTEDALRESEGKYRQLFETMAQGVIIQDASGIIVSANPAAERLLGLSLEQIQGRTSLDPRWRSIHEDGSDFPGESHPVLVALSTGKPVHNVVMGIFNPQKNSHIWLNVSVEPQFGPGEERPSQAQVTFDDITAIRQAQILVQESERRYRTLAETAPVGIFRTDPLGRTTFVNPRWSEITGLPAEHALGDGWLVAVHPDDRDGLNAGWNQAATNRQISHAEYRFIRPDGSIAWVMGQAVPEPDAAGQIAGFAGTITDITERKQAEAALQASEERFRSLYQNATIGLYRTTPEGRILLANPTLVRMLGYDSVDELTSRDLREDGFEPAYPRQEFIDALETHGEIQGWEAAWTRRDGTIIHVRESARAIRDESGRSLYYDGTAEDVTERKQMEMALRGKTAELHTVYDNAPVMMCVFDADQKASFANQTFLDFTGLAAGEVLAATPGTVLGCIHALDDPRGCGFGFNCEACPLRLALADTLETGRAHRDVEFRNTLVTGNVGREVVLRAATVRLDSETQPRVLLCLDDDTERVHAVTALRASEALLRTIVQSEPECVTLVDGDGNLVEMNAAGLVMIEADSLDQVKGKPIANLVAPDDRAAFAALSARVFTGESGQLEYEVVGLKGGHRWLDTHSVPLRDDDGTVTALLSVTRDVTERRQAEERIRRLNRIYTVLSNVNQAIVRVGEESELFEIVCRIAVENGGFRLAWIGLVDEPNHTVKVAAHAGSSDGYLERLRITLGDDPRGLGPTATAVRQGQHVIANDIEHDPRMEPWRADALGRGFRASAAFPLKVAGTIRGAFSLYAAEAGFFDDEEVKLLNELAADVSFALEAFAKDERRTRAEQALAASESELRALFAAMQDAVMVIDRDGMYRKIATTSLDLLARPPEELLGKNLREIFPADQAEWFLDSIHQVLEIHQPVRLEYRLPIGTRLIWFSATVTWLNSETVLWVARDITEQRQTEAALRESEEQYRHLIENSHDIIYTLAADGHFIFVSPAWTALLGHPVDRVIGQTFQNFVHPDDLPGCMEFLRSVIETGQRQEGVEYRVRHIDGSWLWHTSSAFPLRDESGAVIGLEGIASDITGRRDAEQALREASHKLNLHFEQSPLAMIEWSRDSRVTKWNPAAAEVFGFSAEEVLGRGASFIIPEMERPQAERAWRTLLNTRESARATHQNLRRDGTTILCEWFDTPLVDDRGNVVAVTSMVQDVTEHRRAEQALEASEEKYRSILESMEEAVYEVDLAGNLTFFNESLCRLLGYPAEELLGMNDRQFAAAETAKALFTTFNEVYRTGLPGRGGGWTLIRRDGTTRTIDASAALRRNPAGEPIGFRGVIFDTTEQTRHEAALREGERHFRELFEAHPVAMCIFDPASLRILAVNPAATRTYGWSEEEFGAKTVADMWVAEELPSFEAQLVEGNLNSDRSHELWHHRRKDGAVFEVEKTGYPVTYEGRPARAFTVQDVTERRNAEERLLQSQKMEAVGQLAGGIAHDFNNILQAMLALVTVLRLRAPSPEMAATVAEIETHIRRGATLTQQLLLFSRREISQHGRQDLGEAVGAASQMLKHLIPEIIKVRLDLAPEPLWFEGDASQIQQVLINLAVNAKDAMPAGGAMVVRTGRLDTEIWLEVEDQGGGIAPEVQARIFEPFFTTKAAGHGTGLGLAVVHGIVKRHGGRIEVSSQLGVGSRFRVTLPQSPPPEEVAKRDPSGEIALPAGHGKRVLVVEDEEGARNGLVEVLEFLGYAVASAGSAEEALALTPAAEPELLLTDLMLPGIDGPTLARTLAERWPKLKVILMSGYTEDEAVRRGVDQGRMRFLQKPFDMTRLSQELEATLAQ